GRIGRIRSRVSWVIGYGRTIRNWGREVVALAGDVDVWHAHDLTGLLAVGPRVKRPTRLVYDSHEIFMETGSAARLPGPMRRLLAGSDRRWARGATALITVNGGYEAVLKERLEPRRTAIVRNCPPLWTAGDDESPLRGAMDLGPDARLVLYHG